MNFEEIKLDFNPILRVGDVIRVMNLSSRTTVSGRIAADGSVHVGLAP